MSECLTDIVFRKQKRRREKGKKKTVPENRLQKEAKKSVRKL